MAEPVWTFVTPDKRKVPEGAVRESARSSIRNFFNWMRRSHETSSFSIDAELGTVPSHLLDTAAPVPDWKEAADSFLQSLKQWDDEHKEALLRPVLIGPPGSATSQILNLVASLEGYTVFKSPSQSDLLKGGSQWLKHHHFEKGITYVIPELEKFYLRHHLGLSLVRALIHEIKDKEAKVIVGCDSWAWAYLTKVIGLGFSKASPLTLEALDGTLLCRWLKQLAGLSCQARFVFRATDTGQNVLPSDDSQDVCSTIHAENSTRQHTGETEIFRHIASRSRGIPLVAWAIWRQCLEIASDEATDETFFHSSTGDKPSSIWVEQWSKVILPKLTSQVQNPELIVLHTLLIHSGLADETLAELLPFSEMERNSALDKLSAAGLVKLDDMDWRVTLLGYPSIRDNLAAEGYLIDEI